jgi:hypothetical protein
VSYGKKLTGATAAGAGVLAGFTLAAPAHAATGGTYLREQGASLPEADRGISGS